VADPYLAGAASGGPSETSPWAVSARFLELVGLGGLLGLLLSHGGNDETQPAMPQAQPLARMGGPGVGQVAGSLPQLPNGPNLGQQLGGALANSSSGGDYSAGLSALQAPQAMPANHGGLQAMLRALGIL
jgi:hypothetical protein